MTQEHIVATSVEAEEFIVKLPGDSPVRARLGLNDEDQPVLALTDAEEKVRVAAYVNGFGESSVALYDGAGTTRVGLESGVEDTFGVNLFDAQGTIRVRLACHPAMALEEQLGDTMPEQSAIFLFDANGQTQFTVAAAEEFAYLGLGVDPSDAGTVVKKKDGSTEFKFNKNSEGRGGNGILLLAREQFNAICTTDLYGNPRTLHIHHHNGESLVAILDADGAIANAIGADGIDPDSPEWQQTLNAVREWVQARY